jgi:hypothetical protein
MAGDMGVNTLAFDRNQLPIVPEWRLRSVLYFLLLYLQAI